MSAPAVSRRDLLKIGALGAAALAIPWQGVLSAKSASRIASNKIPRPYTVPFAVPPVLRAVRSDATTDYYRVVQRPFVGQILPGVQTPLWGYEGMVPGPTIKATRGRRTIVRQVNALPAVHPTLGYTPWTSTHLHGMPSEPQYDGYAGDNSMPGQWKDYVYPNSCEARTLWYHDHGVHHTAENVYMGLAGQYHVSDPVEAALPIPRGAYDVPLTIGDVAFAENGSLLWDDNSHSGVYGDVILVNGRPWPTMRVEQRKYRFRILNASIARGYRLRLSNGQPFQVIATDGGLMSAPQTVTQITVGMAERYEIVVDFAAITAGQKIQLVNLGVNNAVDYDHTGKVMQFEVSGPATDTRNNSVPATLAPPHPAMALTAGMSTATRRMRLERTGEPGLWSINGKTWKDVEDGEYEPLFARVDPGAVEIWEVENRSGGWFHPLHIHLVDFQVLSRNGRPPRPEERGPKDVVYVGENETVRLLMRFSSPDGPHGRYMVHCHNLSHEDHDMMTQFQVGAHDPDCDPIHAAPPSSAPEPAL
ncbi:multicopper oxidase family protein [Geodermatophilus sp. FMUSA9-8]|uniref:multicopper oxidase family protein n=1 Tax=Geodermatophilus sp. FMUSA9-8 TaxID=3120155 RepID=UPI0030087945